MEWAIYSVKATCEKLVLIHQFHEKQKILDSDIAILELERLRGNEP